MGITLHFRGRLKDLKDINRLKEDLIDIARIMHWEWDSLDEDRAKENSAKSDTTVKFSSGISDHFFLKGILLQLHPNCEPLVLFFDKDGWLQTLFSLILKTEGKFDSEAPLISVKTQFAPPDIHITIVKLLEFIRNRYIPDLEVIDEGGYWENRDQARLIEKFTLLNEKMDLVKDMLSSADRENIQHNSTDELAKIIEEKLRDTLNGERHISHREN